MTSEFSFAYPDQNGRPVFVAIKDGVAMSCVAEDGSFFAAEFPTRAEAEQFARAA